MAAGMMIKIRNGITPGGRPYQYRHTVYNHLSKKTTHLISILIFDLNEYHMYSTNYEGKFQKGAKWKSTGLTTKIKSIKKSFTKEVQK